MEHQFFKGIKFYKDKKTGYWISTTQPRKRMHVVVWEYYNGCVQKGFHIHHKDKNKSNNKIENLILIDAHSHASLHMTKENLERIRQLADKYRHLTKVWHASEEGRKWHTQHGILGWEKKKEIEKVCEYCNEKYLTKIYRQRFCSNKCKSAHRRNSKVDDIESICEFCIKKYRKNKYDKTRTCSKSCAAKIRWCERNKKKAE